MLEGDRVVLRPIQSWDRERLYELVETIEARALSSGMPPLPLSLEEVEARDTRWIEERHRDSAWFAIDVDAELIGICGLHRIDHYQQHAEIGIRIGVDFRSKGHGQDAVRTLLHYGFRHLNLAKVSLRVLADDERAVGAYRKAGFVEEGRLRAHAWYDGARHDELVMSVLREEWTPPASSP
jgi:RimJ/RimL family protein N-acetyltransferase